MMLKDQRSILILRFTTRKIGKHGRPMEIAHFYIFGGGKLFSARCEHGIVTSFLERSNITIRRSRTGKTIYFENAESEEIFRKLVIFSGIRQCTRSPSKIVDIIEATSSLGEFETVFWYSKMIEEYEKRGFWGVCRVAKAFRTLYRID